MKKNGQYVGVDEKYIPEEEKYVNNETNEEIKDSINDGLRSVKNYVTDKDNQEKFKKTGKKGLKILKGFGIGYLAYFLIIIVVAIIISIVVVVNMIKTNNKANDIYDQAGSIIDKVTDEMNNNSGQTNAVDSKADIQTFNAPFELYSGSQLGFFLKNIIDMVVTNNKTENEHIITIVYNETITTLPEDITALKQNIEDSKEYEVSLDYNDNGFINKITIK